MMPSIEIQFSEELRLSCKGISLAYLTVSDIKGYDVVALEELIKETLEDIRKTFDLTKLGEQRIVRAYRDFYWHELKIDPTKQRPAAEALLRRILRGKPMPRIHPLVDLCNVFQLKTLLCIGIYDLDKVKGNLVLRRSKVGEIFYPIGSLPRALKGREIVFSDSEKILHVFPHRDSKLTAISENTSKALIVLCGVPGVSAAYLKKSLKNIKEVLKTIVECSVSSERIVST